MPDILVSGPSPPKRPNVLKLSPPVPQVPLIVKSEPQEYLMQQPQPSTTNLSQTESTSMSSKTNRNNNNVIESLDTGKFISCRSFIFYPFFSICNGKVLN